MNESTHLDLFSGIGGFALAASWAGFRTVAFCETDKYCQKVLAKNFGAEVVADSVSRGCVTAGVSGGISKVSERRSDESVPTSQPSEVVADPQRHGCNGTPIQGGTGEGQTGRRVFQSQRHGGAPLLIPDIRDLDGRIFAGVTLVTGGFPCQPFSVAGQQRGAEDHRHLWPEMFRVIKEARPDWVLGENVVGLITMELDSVLSDLEGIGYSCRAFVVPACAVDAPHRRMRVWIVGHSKERTFGTGLRENGQTRVRRGRLGDPSESQSMAESKGGEGDQRGGRQLGKAAAGGRSEHAPAGTGGEAVAQSNEPRLQGLESRSQEGGGSDQLTRLRGGIGQWAGWEPEPAMGELVDGVSGGLVRFGGRVATGTPNRVAKLKALGNSIVPQCAFPFLKTIHDLLL